MRLWDLATGQSLRTLEGHTDAVSAVAVLPDGRRALSGSDDNTLRLWDLASGETLRTLEGHTARVSAVAVLPDGSRALSGSVGQHAAAVGSGDRREPAHPRRAHLLGQRGGGAGRRRPRPLRLR